MLLFGIAGPSGMNGLGDTTGVWDQIQSSDGPPSGSVAEAAEAAASAGSAPSSWTLPSQPTAQGSGTPWWSTALSTVSKAGADELISIFRPGGATKPATSVPRATPWYATPVGIGGIALGIVAVVMLLRR